MTTETLDFRFSDHGTICILFPASEAGIAWADLHLPDDALRWARGYVIEPRYVAPIIDGIIADGLSVGAL